jgi:hypothetical protein
MVQAAAVVVTIMVAQVASAVAAGEGLIYLAQAELAGALPALGRSVLEMVVLAEVAEVVLATSEPLLGALVVEAGAQAVVAAAVPPAPAATAWSF